MPRLSKPNPRTFVVSAGVSAFAASFTVPVDAQTVINTPTTVTTTIDDGGVIDNTDVTIDPTGVIRPFVLYRGDVTLVNNGLIRGNIEFDTSVGTGPNSISFRNINNLFGNITLSGSAITGGDDQVVLLSDSVFARSEFQADLQSIINLGFGDDVLVLDGTDPDDDAFLSLNLIGNVEELRIQGDAVWLVDGFAEFDNGFRILTNASGQFFSGVIEANTTIAAGGSLENAFGTLDGNVNNSGTIASTRSFFPFSITGNYNANAGSTTDVTVDPRGSAGTIVVNGDVNVAAGANLAVTETLEVFPNQVSFTVVTAGGTINNGANFATVTNDFPFLDATLDTSDPNNITVTLTRNGTGFSGVAETGNQRNVAFIWEVAGAAAGTGTDALFIDGELNTLSDDDLRAAFTSMSGESQTAPARVATQASRGFGRGLERRSRMMHVVMAQGDVLPTPQLASYGGLTHDLSLLSAAALSQPGQPNAFDTFAPGFWVDVLGGEGDVDGDGSSAGVDYDYYGLVGGFDFLLSGDWLFGVSAGYTTGSYDVDDFSADGDIDTLNIAAYTAWLVDQWRFNASIGYAFDSYDTSRVVSVGTLPDRVASADFDGGTFSIDGTATYRFDLDGDFKLEPFGTIEYFRSRTDGYSETGAGALNLFVSEGSYEALYTTLGARLFKTFQMDSTLLTPEVRGGWQHEWLDHEAQFDARFLAAGVGAPVRITGAEADADAALLGVGLTADFNRRFSLRFDYDARVGSDQTDQQFTLALRVPW